jgi:hypothetical protein
LEKVQLPKLSGDGACELIVGQVDVMQGCQMTKLSRDTACELIYRKAEYSEIGQLPQTGDGAGQLVLSQVQPL